jgi:hypothetical protein
MQWDWHLAKSLAAQASGGSVMMGERREVKGLSSAVEESDS